MTLTRKTLYILVALAMVVTMMLASALPVSAQQGPEIRVTDSEDRADQPDVAVDSNGNVHIAFSAGTNSYYQTFGTSPNRYTVIQWATAHHGGYGPGEFQAILYENGNIEVNIADSSGASGSITGVNQGDGTHGVDVGGTPASSTSHRFTWNAGTSDYDYSGIAYDWVDASGGTPVGAREDDSSGSVPIGFAFTFYGTAYNTVYVSSNVYMSFTDTDPTSTGGPANFPSADADTADVIAPLWDDWDPEIREIWYTMLDNNGNTLIDDTRITLDDSYNSVHPAIVVDSNDMVHIVWQEYDGCYIFYTKLDPSQDDRDGDAANPATITVVDDKDLYYDSSCYQQAPRMAVDSNDDIHIVWEDYNGSNIYYMKIDDSGNTLVAATSVRYGPDWYGRPDVAVDSNDNPHITWNDDEDTDTYEIYYMMLDGSNGNTLIDATLITPDDDEKSKRQSIVVDSEDKVHIIWQDQRGTATEIYYTKLDPSLDDRDGDAASEPAITLIDDTALTPDDGAASKSPAIAMACGRYIHMTWYEEWEYVSDLGAGYHDGDIHYMVLDNNGNTVVSDQALVTENTADTSTYNTMPWLDVDARGKAHIVWCDDRDNGDETYEVYYTSYQGPPCAPPPGVPTLSQWGMIVMGLLFAALLIWSVRRRWVVSADRS